MRTAERKPSFNQEEYRQAASVNILEYLRSHGYDFEKQGHEYRLKLDPSLTINENGEWYWNYRDIGGISPIFLLKEIESIGTVEAVKRLCGNDRNTPPPPASDSAQKNNTPETAKDFILPERNSTCKRLFAYLNITRCIDAEIIQAMLKQRKIYESSDYHNAVFVAYDRDGVAHFATLRGTSSKTEKPFRRDADGCDKSYPFAMEGKTGRLYVFESAIDSMSHATITKMYGGDWQADHRIALSGMNNDALRRYVEENKDITDIIFCLDNDYAATYKDGSPAPNWGQVRAAKLHDEYSALGYNCSIETPMGKDVNEDLTELVYQIETEDDHEENMDEDYGLEIC